VSKFNVSPESSQHNGPKTQCAFFLVACFLFTTRLTEPFYKCIGTIRIHINQHVICWLLISFLFHSVCIADMFYNEAAFWWQTHTLHYNCIFFTVLTSLMFHHNNSTQKLNTTVEFTVANISFPPSLIDPESRRWVFSIQWVRIIHEMCAAQRLTEQILKY